MNVELKNPNTFIINGKSFEIPDVKYFRQFLVVDSFLYILAAFPNLHPNQNRNILKFDFNGNLIWQVEEIKGGANRECPFTSIRYENGVFIGYNWLGVDYSINLETGKNTLISTGRPW